MALPESTISEAEVVRTETARQFARRFSLGTQGLLAASLLITPENSSQIVLAILVALLAAASYTDFRWHRIPNWLTYPALGWTFVLTGLTFQSAPAAGTLQLGSALLGATACFGCMVLVYRLAGSGAGDVKLAAAIGAIVGVEAGISVILWCHILAGVVMLVWQASRTDWRQLVSHVAFRLGLPISYTHTAPFTHTASVETATLPLTTVQVPLAAFFAVGTLLTLSGASLL